MKIFKLLMFLVVFTIVGCDDVISRQYIVTLAPNAKIYTTNLAIVNMNMLMPAGDYYVVLNGETNRYNFPAPTIFKY